MLDQVLVDFCKDPYSRLYTIRVVSSGVQSWGFYFLDLPGFGSTVGIVLMALSLLPQFRTSKALELISRRPTSVTSA